MRLSLTALVVVAVFYQVKLAASQGCTAQPRLVEEGRKCKKACQSDSDCKGKLKRCRCDDACGMTCFNPNSICEAPEEIPHGSINGNWTYNQTITYSCDEDYFLKGNRIRRCRSDKKWSGSQPTCHGCTAQPSSVEQGRKCRKACRSDSDCKGELKRCRCDGACGMTCFNPNSICEAPEEIPHGSINGNWTYNQTITYSCDEGYILKGNTIRRCRSDKKWSGSQPTCHVKPFCSIPKPQDNGYPNSFKDTFLPGNVVNYVCKLGYVMRGSSEVRCQENGNWTEAEFSCSRKRCPEPLVPDNGYKEGSDYNFGSRVHFFCNEGYTMLERQNYRTCSVNGKWNGQLPTCEVVICPVPVAPNQGSVDTILTEYPYNTRVQYSCQRDFKLVGSAIGVCDENGSWGDAPSCEVDKDCNFDNFNRPFCAYENIRSRWRRVSSANVPFGSRGFVARLDFESLPLPAAEVATLRSPSVDSDQGLCLKFYYLLGTLRQGEDFVVMMSSSGNAKREIWRGNSKERKNSWLNADIRIAPSLRNVNVEFVARKSRTRFPTSLDLDEISLSSSDQCENECEVVVCQNGGTCRNRVNSFECLCRSGYEGTNCETRTSCRILNIPNTTYHPARTIYNIGDRITYSCNRGLRQMVPGDLTCGQSGQWTRDGQVLTESRHPSCSRILCPANSAGRGMHVEPRKGEWIVDDKARFFCDGDMQLVGSSSATCQESGTWSTEWPRCTDGMECTDRSLPANCTVSPVKSIGQRVWRVGQSIRYSCEPGFKLLGLPTSRCTEGGTWSSDPPVCAALPMSKFQVISESGNKVDHQRICRRRGGNLAIIRTEEEQSFLVNITRKIYPGRSEEFYLGMFRVGRFGKSKGYFKWRDNTIVNDGYNVWNNGEPNDSNGEDCGTLLITPSSAGWNDLGCFRKRFSICETDYDPCLNNPCLNGGTCRKQQNTYACSCPSHANGHRCENALSESRFRITNVKLNFEESRQRCRNLGGDLAIINNLHEEALMAGRAKSLYPGEVAVYIGLKRRSLNNRDFQWISGRRVSTGYNHWNYGEPNNYGGNEHCGIMFIGHQTTWNDIACQQTFYAVCEIGLQCSPPRLQASVQILEPQIEGESYRVGTKLTLTCGSRRILVGGTQIISCQESGRWNSTAGTCQTFCKPPAILFPVKISTSSHHSEPFLVGHVVQFECTNPNQVPNGAESVSCQGTGLWTDRAPTRCVNRGQAPSQCPVIRSPSHGNMQQVGPVQLFRLESVVEFTCDDGYKRIGPSRISCESNYVWSADAPTCKEIGCTLARSPAYLRIFFIPGVEYSIGHQVQAKCVSDITRNVTLTCLGGHRWNPRISRELC